MTTVMILPDNPGSADSRFRAVAGSAQSEGSTAGAALDALAAQMGNAAEDGMLVVVRPVRPDSFFSEAERDELEALMTAWRAARDQNRALGAAEQARLEQLVTAELIAAGRRSAALARDMRP
jgi:hypothetical protein